MSSLFARLGRARWGARPYHSYWARLIVQLYFAIVSVVIGVQFARFVAQAQGGADTLPVRPPGVEGYLPISGLMGIVDWIHQGQLNGIHPAATWLLLIFLAASLLFRRSFCSWICPVGLLSELLARAGQRLFGRNFRLPLWLDRVLRSIRYLLLGFFVWAILMMTARELQSFIQSPYNRVADVKMFLFFVRMSTTAAVSILVLCLASVFVHGAWCRYLCPYGALIGLAGWFSPARVHRNHDRCIQCGLCDRVCMSRLPVSRKQSVGGVECTGCLDCVSVCPVDDTLEMRTAGRRWSPLAYGLAIAVLFAVGYVGGHLTDHWRTQISDREYIGRIAEIDAPEYGHPGRQ